ncbi:hypothetical protein [Solirhodobacter olei]|uniref:hypothetical protein n=1 Tax=Solirhodobacter olei TaxID=2493082 RepID=UPI000FDC8D50|nr:hypothetical protein [Solirhodobacter olei]
MIRTSLAALLCLVLAGCMGEGPPKLPPVGAASVAASKSRCEATGGRWAGKPGAGMLCFRTPPDAGKLCRRASDCTSGCLAKSRTCSPVTPLIGCQDLLDESGRVVKQCVN